MSPKRTAFQQLTHACAVTLPMGVAGWTIFSAYPERQISLLTGLLLLAWCYGAFMAVGTMQFVEEPEG